MKYHNYSNEQLIKALDAFEGNTVAAIKKAATMLVELAKRRQTHPLMFNPMLRHYQDIENGVVSVRAVIALAAQPNRFKFVRAMPLQIQEDICDRKEFVVAEHNAEGQIVAKSKSWDRMTEAEIRMVFADGKVQAFEDQKKIVAAKSKEVRRSISPINVRYDADTEEVVIGQMRIPVAKIAEQIAPHWIVTRGRKIGRKDA